MPSAFAFLVDDLRATLEQQGERPFGSADVDGLPQPVQDQDVLMQ